MTGRVVHFEIPFDDDERASKFYREAFGWVLTPMADMGYTMVSTGPAGEGGMPGEPGFINGGMMRREDPIGTPVVVIDVEDIDAALKQVAALGGSTVLDRQQVGEMGFAAYFKDSEGNLLGLWQNA